MPEKAGQAYAQVPTGTGWRALMPGLPASARLRGAPLRRADTLVGMGIKPQAAASNTGDHTAWRRALIISAACAFVCGVLTVTLLISGSWLYAQAVFHDPTSRTLYGAMRLCALVSLLTLPPVAILGIHHLSNLLKHLSPSRGRLNLIAIHLTALLLGAGTAIAIYLLLASLNNRGII